MKNHSPFLSSAVILISLLIIVSCKKEDEPVPIEPVPISVNANQAKLIESGNAFAFDVFRKVTENAGESENIIISPLSISVALSMTLNGADGETRTALLEGLRSAGISADVINESYKSLIESLLSVDKRVLISIANSVWTEDNFASKKEFIDILTKYYNAEGKSFNGSDQGAPGKINDWIDAKTNGLISEMIESLDPNTVMLLINAIYFKGQWNSKFENSKTVEEAFRTPVSSVTVPMMKQEHEFRIFRGEGFVIAEFPYGQGNFVMDVLLPNEQNGINNIIRDLTPESFSEMTGKLSSGKINVSFPRFKYRYKQKLNEILSDMGMGLAFNADLADFSNISDKQLYINKVLHQAFIETNEEGTEAAAATVVEIGLTSAGPLFTLKLDHPFMYLIREVSTNSIVFMGRVSNPAAR